MAWPEGYYSLYRPSSSLVRTSPSQSTPRRASGTADQAADTIGVRCASTSGLISVTTFVFSNVVAS